MSKTYAVLTGDIVGSTRRDAPPMAEVRRALHAAVGDYASADPDTVVGAVDIFRGDSWQLLLASPGDALRAAILLRSGLKARTDLDTRIAIGIGPAEGLDSGKISASSGEAFLASGRMLDEMGKKQRLALAPSPCTQSVMSWMPVFLDLVDVVVADWSQRRAEIAAVALSHPEWTHEEIGAFVSAQRGDEQAISQQGVSDHLAKGHVPLAADAAGVFAAQHWDWRTDDAD